MLSLPPGVCPYKRTRTFTEDDVPIALTREHRTRSGVWAKVIVESGQLAFTLQETGETHQLAAGTFGIAAPVQTHWVAPQGAVRFYVEFWR